MADTYTPFLNLTKPTIGGDTNEWGTLINADMDAIDAGVQAANALAKTAVQTDGTNPVTIAWDGTNINVSVNSTAEGAIWTTKNLTPSNYLPVAGGTLTGALTIDNTKASQINLQYGDAAHYHVLRGDAVSPGTVITDQAGNHVLRIYSQGSSTPNQIDVVGLGNGAYSAFKVGNGTSEFDGRVYFNNGPGVGNGGGEVQWKASDGNKHLARARNGGGIEWINNAYNGIPIYWDDGGNLNTASSVNSPNGNFSSAVRVGAATIGNDGNIYMPWRGDYLSNVVIQGYAGGNGWVRFGNGLTICWGSFGGTYWTFPRYMTNIWAFAGASSSASTSGAANNVSNVSNTGCTWYTMNNAGGWGVCIGAT